MKWIRISFLALLILVACAVGPARAQTTATFTYPTDGAVNVDSTQPFEWTSISGARAYSLTVGTSQHASDLINTGEIYQTSHQGPALPVGYQLWARIWTKSSSTGAWTYSEISFTTARGKAAFVYPTNGATAVNTSKPFQWTAVSDAQGYYLKIGTTRGAQDLLNSGERPVTQTSYTVPPLPSGRTLWARLHTKLNGSWSAYSDISFTAAPGRASFTYPTNGAVNVDTSKAFQWTAAPDAQRYYLKIGTTQGAQDLLNSGERPVTQTSYTVPPLPSGRTLWARLHTKLNGSWSAYQDISFTAAPGRASFTYPTNGAVQVDLNKDFRWTAAPDAQGYYLKIGTTQGAQDLLNSGERPVTQTSYTVPPLPSGRTLWARLHTKLNGSWSACQDISFTAASSRAIFIYPKHGAQNVNTSKPFQWTAAPDAQSYYLKIGTTQGAQDLLNSGERPVTQTSYTVPPLPVGQTLWARIYTKLNGSWTSYQDINFTADVGTATFTYPLNGAQNVDTNDASKLFQWRAVPGAEGYYLYVGTRQAANDLVNTGQIPQTSYTVPPLPVGSTLWARIWTKAHGTWTRYSDISFTSNFAFSYPTTGSTDVDLNQPFRWDLGAVLNGVAPVYSLTIGTAPGASNLLNAVDLQQNSYTVPDSALPVNQTLYARVRLRLGDNSVRFADAVFMRAGSTIAPAQIIYPANGATNVDVSDPFQWSTVDLSDAYQLQILDGGSVVRDTGEIRVPRYFAEDLPLGNYTARLGTKIAGQWHYTGFSFTVVQNGGVMAKAIASAHWATDFVRQMADGNNFPYTYTELYTQMGRRTPRRTQAYCSEYRDVLLTVLREMNVVAWLPLEQRPRRLDISFVWESHTLVEMYSTDDNAWIILDPTFAVAPKRVSDGRWATKEDFHNSVLAGDWEAFSYVSLGSYGDSIAKNYYVDYALLFLSIPPLPPPGGGLDPLPYLHEVPLPKNNSWGLYFLQSDQSPVEVLVNGKLQSFNCSGAASLSICFGANTIALPEGSTAQIKTYKLNRYFFK